MAYETLGLLALGSMMGSGSKTTVSQSSSVESQISINPVFNVTSPGAGGWPSSEQRGKAESSATSDEGRGLALPSISVPSAGIPVSASEPQEPVEAGLKTNDYLLIGGLALLLFFLVKKGGK